MANFSGIVPFNYGSTLQRGNISSSCVMLQDKAPHYLSNYCVPVSEVASRQQLQSASRHQLLLISHDIVSAHSAVGLLLWLARRSGTHWQMNCELTLVIGLNQLWRLSSLPPSSVFSALEAFAVMRYINWWLTLTLTLTLTVFFCFVFHVLCVQIQ